MLWILTTLYAGVALAFLAGALLNRRVRGGRDALIDGYDRVLLVSVGIIASAIWPLFVPVYATGWFGSPRAGELARAAEVRWDALRARIRRIRGMGWMTH